MQKVKVSERALLQRLNRYLAEQKKLIKKCRENSPNLFELGRFYVVNTDKNTVTAKHICLDKWGRDSGVLKNFEVLSD